MRIASVNLLYGLICAARFLRSARGRKYSEHQEAQNNDNYLLQLSMVNSFHIQVR